MAAFLPQDQEGGWAEGPGRGGPAAPLAWGVLTRLPLSLGLQSSSGKKEKEAAAEDKKRNPILKYIAKPKSASQSSESAGGRQVGGSLQQIAPPGFPDPSPFSFGLPPGPFIIAAPTWF